MLEQRVAIELLTLWMDDRQQAAEYIAHIVDDPDEEDEPVRLIAGLLNLNMLTIVRLAKAEGADDIEARAGDILREWLRPLPG